MDQHESLSHSTWECTYHVVFIPKCRRKTLYAELRRHLGEVFRRLAEQKESRVEEGHLMPDHVHMMISVPVHLGLLTQPTDPRPANRLMRRHVPSRSEATCRYVDGLVQAKIDAYGCDERVRRQQS